MKKTLLLVLVLVIVSSVVGIVSATEYADEIFSQASVSLSSNKVVVFNAETDYVVSSIKVTAVYLYRMVGNSWSYVGTLPIPADETVNNWLFTATYNYSSYIGTGKYRIKATFCADGHYVTRYSNDMTY